MPDSVAPTGSFNFPEKSVGRDTETYIRHFTTAPISEQTLSNAVYCYERHLNRIIVPLARERVDDYIRTPEGTAWIQGMSEWQADVEVKRMRDEAFEEIRKEKDLPRYLSPQMANSVLRAGQMSYLRGLLGSEEEKEEILAHTMETAVGERTVDQLAIRYGTSTWITDAVSSAGDLRSSDRLEALLKETMQGNAMLERMRNTNY